MRKDFFSVFKFQSKLFLNLKIGITLLILLVLTFGFVQNGISNYKGSLEQKKVFQDYEQKRVEQFFNYRVYGLRGFRLLFFPDPVSIFFINSVTISDMNAFADSSEQLNIYKPLNTKTVFELRKNWFTDYSGILLIIGTLLCLFYGFQTFKNTEHIRMLCSIIGHKKLFWYVFFARALLIGLILLVFMLFSILLIALNGFQVPFDKNIITFFLMGFGLLLLTFSMGLMCGTMKSGISGILCALLIWAISIFFVPMLPEIIASDNANAMTPIHQLDLEKLIIFMNWEKMMLEKEGILKLGQKPSESFQNRMLAFKENELKKLQAMEEDQIARLKENKSLYQLLASFFPTSFYQSANNEISGRGFNSLVDFCQFALKEKLQFISLIIEKEYFSNYAKVEQFNAGNNNIYKANPSFPDYFLPGVICTFLWLAVFIGLSYSLFKKKLFALPGIDKMPARASKHIRIKSKAVNSWRVSEDYLHKYLYNLLSGETGQINKNAYPFTLSFDGESWRAGDEKQNFLYLCHPREIPGQFKAGNFLALIMDLVGVPVTKRNSIIGQFSLAPLMPKRFDRLNKEELGFVFLAILEMKPFTFYLIDDIGRKMYWDFCYALLQKMNSLSSEGTILFLNEGDSVIHKNDEEKLYFNETDSWANCIISMKSAYAEPGNSSADMSGGEKL